MLGFLAARAIPGVEAVTLPGPTPGCYARSIRIGKTAGSLLVEPGSGHALRATIRCTRLSALPVIIARLRRVFDLAADPVAIAADPGAEDRRSVVQGKLGAAWVDLGGRRI